MRIRNVRKQRSGQDAVRRCEKDAGERIEREKGGECGSGFCRGVVVGLLAGMMLCLTLRVFLPAAERHVVIVSEGRGINRINVINELIQGMAMRASVKEFRHRPYPVVKSTYRLNWMTPLSIYQFGNVKDLNREISLFVKDAYRHFRNDMQDDEFLTSSSARGINEQFFSMQKQIWMSEHRLWIDQSRETNALKATIYAFAQEYLARIGRDDIDISTSDIFMWAAVCERCISHAPHIHENSVLSGVYYVEVPRGSGSLMFEDPRGGGLPPFGGRIVHEPKEGELVLFPSWLLHHVGPSCVTSSDMLRISLSFNIVGSWGVTSDVSVEADTTPSRRRRY